MLSKFLFRPQYFKAIVRPITFFEGTLPESPVAISNMADMAPSLEQKLESLEKSQPFFDRLIFFDPDIMASLPGPLQVFDPIVEATKVLFFF